MFQDLRLNRGAAVAGDRLFLETDNAHIHIAIDRLSGQQLWDSPIADSSQNTSPRAHTLACGLTS